MFDNSKVSDISIIKPAERVEGCELVLMKRDQDPQSKSFRSVSFTFKQKSTGSEITHKEFAPNRVIAGKTIDNENFKKNIAMGHSRIANITRAFLDEATFLKIVIPGNIDQALASGQYAAIDAAWDQYIVLSGQALQASATEVGKAKGVDCALKVVYNGKYAALPKVPPFISTVNHPKQFTTNPQYDKYTQDSITPDKEQPTMQNSGGGFAAPSAGAPSWTQTTPAGDFNAAPTNHPAGF